MSRCFPYPPPGYVRNGIRDEALIESIKLQREGGKAKKERKKDKKCEKKENDKKEKEKSRRGNGEVESKQHHHKKRHRDEKNRENVKGRDLQHKTLQHKTLNEKEQLENSGLTEEHGHPVESQNSFDSTLNSQKRQKLSSSPNGGHNFGSIIRIRLPLERQKDPDVLPNEEQPCVASGRIDDPFIQVMHEPALTPGRDREEHPCFTSSKVGPDVTLRHNDENCSTGAPETSARKEETSQASSLCGVCPPDLALKFRNIIGNWVPPTLQNEVTDGDEDWLFESKQNQKCGFRCEVDIRGSSHANTTTCPQVCFLPEVDIYALPFTVPY